MIFEKERCLHKIEEALRLFDQGIYGICSSCGEYISYKRLRKVPFTDLCIDCAKEKEKG